ncbi:hypothetical protein FACS189461_1650 [Spirochaetia bacterium]|nr:hypothetical protein FACS189461_1650 [Spirochaetia bacterium]
MILALTAFFYGLVPLTGALVSRRGWRRFRRRFSFLQSRPLLDYRLYRQAGGELVCRFSGGFESLTEEHILWLHGEDLTVPVSLAGAHIYVVPAVGEPAETGSPERIRWGRLSTLSAGAKVFAGGSLTLQGGRRIFASTPENPLLVIFYDGPERDFVRQTIQAGPRRNEYWNAITPYGLILGAFSLLLYALSFLSRPAFSLTVLTAFIAIFTPLMPLIPPGLLFTILYQRLWTQARRFRSYRDLALLPPKDRSGGESPAGPEVLARHYTLRAYTLEIIAWLILLAGIGINVYFIQMIVFLLGNF